MAIPLHLDDSTPIPEELPSDIIFGDKISSTGQHSKLYAASIRGTAGYIIKSIHSDTYGPPGCYIYRQIVRNELLISQRMGDLGIGPKVHAIAMNPYEGFIVMDRYKGNLGEFILQSQDNLQIDNILTSLRESINKMHADGIVHRDLIPTNILYRDDGVVIADYGLAIQSSVKQLQDSDSKFFDAIITMINRIRTGERFRSVRGLVRSASPSVEPLIFAWDGNQCPDWQ